MGRKAGGSGDGGVRVQEPSTPSIVSTGLGSTSTGCPGCQARDQELAWLRRAYERMEDRLMALVNPGALAQFRGETPGTSPANTGDAVESYVDDQGQCWVTVAGRQVKLEDWQQIVRSSGVALPNGQIVPQDEFKQGMSILDAAVSGRAS